MRIILIHFFLLSGLLANAQQQFTFLFDTGKAVTNKDLSQWVDMNPNAKVTKIYGYTDRSGSETFNIKLSERRAAYIYERLKNAGITIDSVEQKGFGESKSARRNSAKDRKVVIHYAGPEAQSNKLSLQTETGKKLSTAVKGDRINLKDVYFRGGTSYVLKESGDALKELYYVMRNNPKLKIEIQGHICCEITDTDNLSEKRASEIFYYLINNGIKANRMRVKGFGSTRPVFSLPERSVAEMAANRRVEIEVLEN